MIVPAKYVMLFRRLVLLPFTAGYGGVLRIRHTLYDHGLLKRTRPEVPTIAIGNLALGGTGKTPMLELVLRTLDGISPLATLSRGYGREGTDIHEVHVEDNAHYSGDEPLQVKRKFPAVRVFVGADRVKAIAHIGQQVPGVRAVVLDDALQHRALDAGLNILLTTWQRPWCDDALIPAGHLRDLPLRAKAAQVVVVTKCPSLPTSQEQQRWRERLELAAEQTLFFSGIRYGPLRAIDESVFHGSEGQIGVLLVTGIADPAPLLAHVRTLATTVEHMAFTDHHMFTRADLQRLAERYANFAAGPKMLVTTEKDAARLSSSIAGSPLEGLPLAVIGMQAVILNEPERFADLIRLHVATHPAHR